MPIKDPQETLDYSVDWNRSESGAASGTGRLVDGETISASTWDVPAGLTQASPAPSNTATTTTIWLSGGTLLEHYDVTNHVTTSQGRHYDHTVPIVIREK